MPARRRLRQKTTVPPRRRLRQKTAVAKPFEHYIAATYALEWIWCFEALDKVAPLCRTFRQIVHARHGHSREWVRVSFYIQHASVILQIAQASGGFTEMGRIRQDARIKQIKVARLLAEVQDLRTGYAVLNNGYPENAHRPYWW